MYDATNLQTMSPQKPVDAVLQSGAAIEGFDDLQLHRG